MSPPRETQRIAKLLARAGIASRREVERMIADGRIAIDGKPVETPATLIPSLHGVTVDGKPVRAPAPARLFRFHKPAGLITAERDPAGRPTIYDRLPQGLPRVMPVGRLDMNTEGLLLLTTDGGLKRQLELPATGVERIYRARAFGAVSQEQLEQLIGGIEIEGIRYGPIDANLERRTGRNQWIELKLREGKNREVRRVLEHLGLKVSRLIRTAYGPFELSDLPPGAVEEVRQHDLVAFRKALSGDPAGAAASRSGAADQIRTRTVVREPQRTERQRDPGRPDRRHGGPDAAKRPARAGTKPAARTEPRGGQGPKGRPGKGPLRTTGPAASPKPSRPGARRPARPRRKPGGDRK